MLFTRSPDLHDRGATLARPRLAGGAEVTVASTHLGLDAAEYHGCRRSLLPLTYRMGRASGVRPGASTSRGAHEGSQGVLDMATFDVGGSWDAIQSNGHRASFALELRGDQGVFHGTASHSGGAVRGHGEGLITGSDFLYTVNWNNGTVGEYNGRFNAEGRITGVTFDKRNPASSATWSSSRRFRRI